MTDTVTDETRCENHSVRIEHLEKADEDKQTWLEKLQNRPPVWCTVVISLLTFLLGMAIKWP